MTVAHAALFLAALTVAGCANRAAETEAPPPAQDAYWIPRSVSSGRQEYAPDYGRFPPVMTKLAGYPTEEQANFALQRSRWATVPVRTLITKEGVKTIGLPVQVPDAKAAGVRIFACRPGALDAYTGRVYQHRGPVRVCAADLLAADGRPLARVPLNFFYWRDAWRVEDPKATYKPVPWFTKDKPLPKSSGWFGSDRY